MYIWTDEDIDIRILPFHITRYYRCQGRVTVTIRLDGPGWEPRTGDRKHRSQKKKKNTVGYLFGNKYPEYLKINDFFSWHLPTTLLYFTGCTQITHQSKACKDLPGALHLRILCMHINEVRIEYFNVNISLALNASYMTAWTQKFISGPGLPN